MADSLRRLVAATFGFVSALQLFMLIMFLPGMVAAARTGNYTEGDEFGFGDPFSGALQLIFSFVSAAVAYAIWPRGGLAKDIITLSQAKGAEGDEAKAPTKR